MKILSIILLVAFLANQSEAAGISDKLKEFLESLREILKHGNESIGLPILDPFELKNISGPFNITFSDDLNGTIDADSLRISKLSDYIVTNADFKITGLKVNVSLVWPEIHGEVYGYDINCRLMDFVNVYGKGAAKFTIKGFNFNTVASITTVNEAKKLGLKSLKIDFGLGEMEIKLDGLYDDEMMSEVISNVVSQLAPEIFDKYYPDLQGKVENFIKDKANEFLIKYTLKELLALLG